MKNRLFSVATLLVAFVATPKAKAEVGGPFDNGDFSVLLERGGVYQATFSYPNGSGMCLFTPDNAFGDVTSAGVTTVNNFSPLNRSLLYYKGITYFGTATGVADIAGKRITGFTNGSSDLGTAAAGGATPTAAIGSNGAIGFTANSNFTAKITSDHPVLRFRGNGQVSFMGPQQQATLRANAQTIFAQYLAGIGTPSQVYVANPVPFTLPPTVPGVPVGTVISSLTPTTASEILGVAQALMGQVDNPSAIEANTERQKMKVYGSRKFF